MDRVADYINYTKNCNCDWLDEDLLFVFKVLRILLDLDIFDEVVCVSYDAQKLDYVEYQVADD